MTVKFARIVLFAILALVVGGCELTRPSEDPVLIKLTELERRLESIERVMQNQSLVNLTQQVSAAERRGDEMQGRVETLEHSSGGTAERQRELYADLDARIQDLESAMTARAKTDGGGWRSANLHRLFWRRTSGVRW